MKNFYRNFLKLCSMLVLQNVVTLSVNLADNIMLGAFSEISLSGVTTVNQVQFVFQQLLMALGDGLVIFGSQYWGKKETEPVRKIGAWAMRTGFFIALVLFIRIPVLSVYQLSPETREMANTFLIILSVVMVGMSYQMPTNGGIIRGSGSIAYSMKVDLISTWGIVIPLSMFMAFVVNASPAMVVCCLNADQIFKCVPAFLKCNYGHWIKNMTN